MIWGGIRVQMWGTDSRDDPEIEEFGEDVEAAIDKARLISRQVKCREVVVLADGTNIVLARFTGRWGLDRKW